jgi:hypothetical protein
MLRGIIPETTVVVIPAKAGIQFVSVMPAKAGIQCLLRNSKALDPGLRRGDKKNWMPAGMTDSYVVPSSTA